MSKDGFNRSGEARDEKPGKPDRTRRDEFKAGARVLRDQWKGR